MKKYTKDRPIEDIQRVTKAYNSAIIINLNKGYTRVIEREGAYTFSKLNFHNITFIITFFRSPRRGYYYGS